MDKDQCHEGSGERGVMNSYPVSVTAVSLNRYQKSVGVFHKEFRALKPIIFIIIILNPWGIVNILFPMHIVIIGCRLKEIMIMVRP